MARHTLAPQTTISDHSAWSAACSKGGDGQCDGIIPDNEELPHGITDECACPCHSGWDDEFAAASTVAEMEQAHATFHRTWS